MMIQPMVDLVQTYSPYPQTTEVWSGGSQSGDHSFPPGILIGDSDPSIRMLAAFKKRGFAVWLAADGEEALEMYGLHQDAINLVLLNFHLPRLDGIETAQVLLDFDPNVACCFMGDGFGEFRMEDQDVLAPVRVFDKPFGLIETVEALWQMACDHQETSMDGIR